MDKQTSLNFVGEKGRLPDDFIMAELERIKNCGHWVAAWWTPDYYSARLSELERDSTSKNKDIEYIEIMGW